MFLYGRKEYHDEHFDKYSQKERRMAFYLSEKSRRDDQEVPPTASVILERDKFLDRVPFIDFPKAKERSVNKVPNERRHFKWQCPSLPMQWRENLTTVVPEAVFHRSPQSVIRYH